MKGGKSKGKRKWKSLTLKVEHLRLELEEREETIDDITREFMEQLSEVAEEDPEKAQLSEAQTAVPHTEIKDAQETTDTPAETPAAPDQDIPEEIKALWKQIAKVAHPDKTGGDEEKTELYKKAAAAMSAGNIDEIVEVASQLGFDLPEASEASVVRLEKVADDLQDRLKNIENSVIWQWASASADKRAIIMALYMKSKGLKAKKK